NRGTGNTITGSHANSYVYGVERTAMQIFGGNRNRITDNRAPDYNTFSDLGPKQAHSATRHILAFHVVTPPPTSGSSLVTHSPSHVVGPVKGTAAAHYSVYMPARHTIGWSCHDGCSPSILRLRNNVIVVGGEAGYEDGKGADEAASVYQARSVKIKLGPGSVVADPRFVSRRDLRLAPSSPARGRAVRLDDSWFGGRELARDFTGKPLPSSTRHAGAYQ